MQVKNNCTGRLATVERRNMADCPLAPNEGKYFSSGYVFVIKDGNLYKIGCAPNPTQRLSELKIYGHPKAELLAKYKANDKMRDAEIAALDALKGKLNVKQTTRTATGWYLFYDTENFKATDYDVTSTVETAVKNHNKNLALKKTGESE